jgi:hypothetical protein
MCPIRILSQYYHILEIDEINVKKHTFHCYRLLQKVYTQNEQKLHYLFQKCPILNPMRPYIAINFQDR